jgi:DNA-directed RNA polymerase III subunit RPC3
LKGKKQEEAIEIATAELVNERCDYDLSAKFMYNGLPRGVKRKFANGSGASNKQARTNGVNGHHADDEDEEENDWSEDEDGFDNIPMEVSAQDRQHRCGIKYNPTNPHPSPA